MPIPEGLLAALGSDVGTPLQQVIFTFREIDSTFSALQRTTELFLWDGDEVPEDKAPWIASYFDRLANLGIEYRELALQEIRAAGREARTSLDVQELQATFHDYDVARDLFDRLLRSMEMLMEGTSRLPYNELRAAAQRDISNIRDAVATIDAGAEQGRETVNRAFATLELLMGSESALESTIHSLTNRSAYTSASRNISAIWEEFTELEKIRTGTYNVARGLLDRAYVIWDLGDTTNANRREILEGMQACHKTLCDQIVPTARLSQDIKEVQLSMTYNPCVVVGPDGKIWSVADLRLSLPAYRVVQKATEGFTEHVRYQTQKLIDLRLLGM